MLSRSYVIPTDWRKRRSHAPDPEELRTSTMRTFLLYKNSLNKNLMINWEFLSTIKTSRIGTVWSSFWRKRLILKIIDHHTPGRFLACLTYKCICARWSAKKINRSESLVNELPSNQPKSILKFWIQIMTCTLWCKKLNKIWLNLCFLKCLADFYD